MQAKHGLKEDEESSVGEYVVAVLCLHADGAKFPGHGQKNYVIIFCPDSVH